ncbi:hypothetical protein CEXT_694761 [Caerostris extrusa]|uniref:Secreted protein n=1 Tax=Caerostris extrusa TaxID=172846 RepID=A0AAV4QDR9_CAEEX|nr:hypothetical protein CEXT_694761 [Caerostris extrusa]
MKASSASYLLALMAGVKNNKRKEERRNAFRGKTATLNPFRLQCSTTSKEEVWPVFPSHTNLMVFYRSLGGTLRCGACCAAECAMHSGMWKFLRLL